MLLTMAPDTQAFFTALAINFVDQVGISFTLPVIVPYGRFIGATAQQIAIFSTVRGIGGFLATLWMPKLSDRKGRKLLLTLGLFGRAVGYFIQGCSGWSADAAIGILLVGRGFSGLFSGSIPVVQAYLTEISGADKELLKQRIVRSQVVGQLAGIALQPISGALAACDLQLPFFVCAIVTMLGCVFTRCFFKDVHEMNANRFFDRTLASPPTDASEQLQKQESPGREPEGNPLFDIVLLLCLTGFFAIVIVIVSIPFLIPLMLTQESFGLQRGTEKETQQAIATAQSLVSIPAGLCNLFVTLVLFLPTTRHCGELPPLLIGGSMASLIYASMGFWVTTLRQLTLALSLGSFCTGFMIPAIGPLIARYSRVRYPKSLAFCQAIPGFGAQLSSSVGQNVMAFAYKEEEDSKDMRLCWLITGFCYVVFTFTCGFALFLVDQRVGKSQQAEEDDAGANAQTGLPSISAAHGGPASFVSTASLTSLTGQSFASDGAVNRRSRRDRNHTNDCEMPASRPVAVTS